ncbi:hypothetical protein BKA70DRAFT_1260775 [Coprinopsis sp. MPI-PUGE-AT-0042]|nr:hypothetical protein BKA70DRAFT_1260775 [Coprinopsis sp. MPI-PUGE-AT-0042]
MESEAYSTIRFRCSSVCILVLSSVGFFYDGFTVESCRKFYLLPPIFKVIQAMVSQAILGVRAFNLSRRSKQVGWFLLTIYFSVVVLQWVASLHQRTPSFDEVAGNCKARNDGKQLGAWVFYAISIIYDACITTMSIYYLLRYKLAMKNTMMAKVTRMMLYDGLGYLLVLTGVNVLNLILYKTPNEIQTAGSSLGYCVSWIMSQRLLIHLYDASREREDEGSYNEAVTISQHIGSARDVSRVIREHLDNKRGVPVDFTRSAGGVNTTTSQHRVTFPDVEVHVERTVKNHRGRGYAGYELEDYSRRSRNHISSTVSAGGGS